MYAVFLAAAFEYMKGIINGEIHAVCNDARPVAPSWVTFSERECIQPSVFSCYLESHLGFERLDSCG